MHADGCVCVQLGDARGSDLVARFSHVIWAQEKLGREVCDSDGGRVVESQTLDTGQGDILCDLYT